MQPRPRATGTGHAGGQPAPTGGARDTTSWGRGDSPRPRPHAGAGRSFAASLPAAEGRPHSASCGGYFPQDAVAVCILSLPDCSREPAERQDPASMPAGSRGAVPCSGRLRGPPAVCSCPLPSAASPGSGVMMHGIPRSPAIPLGRSAPGAEPGTRLLGTTVPGCRTPGQPCSAQGGLSGRSRHGASPAGKDSPPRRFLRAAI